MRAGHDNGRAAPGRAIATAAFFASMGPLLFVAPLSIQMLDAVERTFTRPARGVGLLVPDVYALRIIGIALLALFAIPSLLGGYTMWRHGRVSDGLLYRAGVCSGCIGASVAFGLSIGAAPPSFSRDWVFPLATCIGWCIALSMYLVLCLALCRWIAGRLGILPPASPSPMPTNS